jgi:hypothetical protein
MCCFLGDVSCFLLRQPWLVRDMQTQVTPALQRRSVSGRALKTPGASAGSFDNGSMSAAAAVVGVGSGVQPAGRQTACDVKSSPVKVWNFAAMAVYKP